MFPVSYRWAAVLVCLLFACLPLFAPVALAQGFTPEATGLQEAGKTAGYDVAAVAGCKQLPGGCPAFIAGNVINALLGIFGALFLALIMWGGVQFMFSQGDPGQVKKARQTLTNAFLGMLVVAASYAIANFVLNAIATATTGGGGV